MSQFISNPEITRPSTEPLKSTILDHATYNAGMGHFGLRNNEGLWQSYNCLDTLVPYPTCPNPVAGYKEFGKAVWVPGFDFAVYGGVQCALLDTDRADQQAELTRVFGANEAKGVERALLLNRFVDNPLSSDEGAPFFAAWEAPVDLTPTNPISAAVALAILEGYAAANYPGAPTIHMPRAVASLLNERIVWQGDKAYTRMGSKVAMGGGYDPENADDYDGTWEMFATGEVYVESSPTLQFSEIVIPGDGSGTGSDENGLEQNTALALVERMFRVGIDCFAAKVTVTAAASGAGFGN